MSEPSMLQVVLMGMITVFIVLIAIILIIMLMGKIINYFKKDNEDNPAAAPIPAVPVAAAPVAQGGNSQIVAAISTAIAEDMGTDVSHLRTHSIKKV